jgi:hypothetical protein
MMEHHVDGGLLAYLDRELDERRHGEVEQHMRDCASCKDELARLDAESSLFSGALRVLDGHADPPEQALAAVRREHQRRRARSGMRRMLPYAAAITLMAGGVASATVPGSPVQGWPVALWERVAGTPREAPVVAHPSDAGVEATTAAVPVEAGVTVMPINGRLVIALENPDAGLRIRARLVPQERAEVIAVGAAANARFQTGAGRITIRDAGPGELRLDLPERATEITVTVDGVVYLTRGADRLQLHRSMLDGANGELQFQVGAARPVTDGLGAQ